MDNLATSCVLHFRVRDLLLCGGHQRRIDRFTRVDLARDFDAVRRCHGILGTWASVVATCNRIRRSFV